MVKYYFTAAKRKKKSFALELYIYIYILCDKDPHKANLRVKGEQLIIYRDKYCDHKYKMVNWYVWSLLRII